MTAADSVVFILFLSFFFFFFGEAQSTLVESCVYVVAGWQARHDRLSSRLQELWFFYSNRHRRLKKEQSSLCAHLVCLKTEETRFSADSANFWEVRQESKNGRRKRNIYIRDEEVKLNVSELGMAFDGSGGFHW